MCVWPVMRRKVSDTPSASTIVTSSVIHMVIVPFILSVMVLWCCFLDEANKCQVESVEVEYDAKHPDCITRATCKPPTIAFMDRYNFSDNSGYGSDEACVHGCMCACVYVCICARVHVCMCACVHVCMCASVHVCMCACVRVCMCACMHVCMCASMHACMRARVLVCMCACVLVCTCARVLVCMRACVHVCNCAGVHVC